MAVRTIFLFTPTLSLVGVPDNTPPVLNVNQLGIVVGVNVTASPSGSLVVTV